MPLNGTRPTLPVMLPRPGRQNDLAGVYGLDLMLVHLTAVLVDIEVW